MKLLGLLAGLVWLAVVDEPWSVVGWMVGLIVAAVYLRYGRGPRARRAMRARIREVGTPPAWKRRRDQP